MENTPATEPRTPTVSQVDIERARLRIVLDRWCGLTTPPEVYQLAGDPIEEAPAAGSWSRLVGRLRGF